MTASRLNPLLLFAIGWLLAMAGGAHGADAPFIEGLRERGLYRLAEVHCRDQIDSQQLTDRELAETTIQLSLVFVAQALDSPPLERRSMWEQADAALKAYAERSGPRHFELLTSLQLPLNHLRRAEVERLELLDVGESPARDALRQHLRTTIRQLRDVRDRIDVEHRTLALGRAGGDRPFTTGELASLARHTTLALAQGLALQGLSYPAGSADRDDAVLQAVESLKTLAADRAADTLAWQARVALLEALAELRRTDEGLELLLYWREQIPPADQQAALVAAHARLLIAGGRLDKADEVLEGAPWPRGSSPEVDFARLELAIAGIRAGTADAKSLEPLLATLRTSYRPRWIRRAESLVGSTFAADGSATTAAALQHAAEHYYRAGHFAKAIATYDLAAERYRAEQNREGGFAAERAAAAIALEERQYQDAAARFRRLALGSLDRDDSSTAHREAILALAAAAHQAPPEKQRETIDAYILACREHLGRWPQHPTSDEVRSWLGRILVDRGQWATAIEVLAPLTSASPYADQAMPLLARAYREQAAQVTNDRERQALVATATARLQGSIVDAERQWPSPWTAAQRQTALELARLQLPQGQQGAEYAQRLLTAARRMDPTPSSEWEAEAVPLLAMALVQTGDAPAAVDLLRQTAGNAPSLEPLAAQLVARLAESSSEDRAAVGQLLFASLEVAGDETQHWKLPGDRYRAAALAATGQLDQALPLYETLTTNHPRNGDLQEELAALLTTSPNATHHERALALWQTIETGSKRGGERWFRARRARIAALAQMGRTDEAKKLLQLTRLLYPDLGGPATREQFESLGLD